MDTQILKELIKESIREVLQEERLALCQVLIPYVSQKEQQEIETKFVSPSKYNKEEFIDMTDWIKNESKI